MDGERILEDCVGVYSYKGGYILNRELEVLRVDKDFNEIWSFEGSDVFVTKDLEKYPPVKLVGDIIELYDWNNLFYRLDENGQIVSRTV